LCRNAERICFQRDKTGVTVRPKLYIACGISGAVQHRAGMDESAKIISINTDPNAPINAIADYTIIGNVNDVIPKMLKALTKITH
jgi:electron transfer flavoprotein alpha subunit